MAELEKMLQQRTIRHMLSHPHKMQLSLKRYDWGKIASRSV